MRDDSSTWPEGWYKVQHEDDDGGHRMILNWRVGRHHFQVDAYGRDWSEAKRECARLVTIIETALAKEN